MTAVVLQFTAMPKRSPPSPHNRIRELREAQGMTQETLAERMGTTDNQVSRFETGAREMDMPWMRRLARALGVAPGDLFSLKDQGLSEEERMVVTAMREADDFMREVIVAPARATLRRTPAAVPTAAPAANDRDG